MTRPRRLAALLVVACLGALALALPALADRGGKDANPPEDHYTPLVQETPRFGYVHCLTAGNIFQEHDGVSHAAPRANAKSFQVANSGFLRIADTIVFINDEGRRTRHWT